MFLLVKEMGVWCLGGQSEAICTFWCPCSVQIYQTHVEYTEFSTSGAPVVSVSAAVCSAVVENVGS